MKLVVNSADKMKKGSYFSYDFIKKTRRTPLFQVGGAAPEAMPQEAATPDVQTLMEQFSQSQDPNIAIQILQMLAQPETAAQAVTMLMQAMQGAQPAEAAPQPGEEVPMAAKGMKFDIELEHNLFDRIYSDVTGNKKVNTNNSPFTKVKIK